MSIKFSPNCPKINVVFLCTTINRRPTYITHERYRETEYHRVSSLLGINVWLDVCMETNICLSTQSIRRFALLYFPTFRLLWLLHCSHVLIVYYKFMKYKKRIQCQTDQTQRLWLYLKLKINMRLCISGNIIALNSVYIF